MTLDQAALDHKTRIVRFDSLAQAECLRLSAMGVRQGAEVTKILRTPLRDPVECLVDSQLLALEAWHLPHIVVEAA